MSKLKQSIVVQRQVPEHIRENYPLFVEFIKSYYDYLELTQSRQLESIRDIDTSLDEFIDNFKSEIAKNVPIELSTDKRLLIKHLREFYLARGSEASYKFLFRTLFGKEVELFYPSSQILRVSDGKWKQDVSIFVENTGNSADLFALNGKYIKIKSGNKTIETYVENVLEYTPEIYEVFIQRDYVNNIKVGATVTYSDSTGTYTGTILKCPSKLSIYKPGKGFKIGQLFALKTQIGRGCVVKVTKVSSEGAILAIQVIRFGLDYKSTFYSYLSSKKIEAYEYVHPLKIGAGESSYAEYTATSATQTFNINYLIESGNPLILVDVIRGNTDVTNITYTATTGTSVTISGLQSGDTVKLSGVVIKGIPPAPNDPSYNERTGGFIDYGFASEQTYMAYDESIPIGTQSHRADRYFADPSYVGEIVEQFYADDTSAPIDEDLAIIQIDLGAVARYPGYYMTVDGFISDEMYIQDGNYYQSFSYVLKVEEELRKYADIVKSLLHPAGMKMFSEYSIYRELKLEFTKTLVVRNLQLPLDGHPPSEVFVNQQGYNYNKYDYIDGEWVPAEDASRVYSKPGKAALFSRKVLEDIYSTSDSVYKEFFKNLVETSTASDAVSKFVEKPIDEIQSLTDDLLKDIFKNISETVLQLELISKSLEKPVDDTYTVAENISKLVDKNLSEAQSLVDDMSKDITKAITELQYLVEVYSVVFDKALADQYSIQEKYENNLNKIFSDEAFAAEIEFLRDVTKNLSDALTLTEELQNDFSKALADTQFLTDRLENLFERQTDDTFTLADLCEVARLKFVDDFIAMLEEYSNALAKEFGDLITIADTLNSKDSEKTLSADSINTTMNGRITFDASKYDAENYFEVFQDFQQPATTLS